MKIPLVRMGVDRKGPFARDFSTATTKKMTSVLNGKQLFFLWGGGVDQKSTIDLPFAEADMILFAYHGYLGARSIDQPN